MDPPYELAAVERLRSLLAKAIGYTYAITITERELVHFVDGVVSDVIGDFERSTKRWPLMGKAFSALERAAVRKAATKALEPLPPEIRSVQHGFAIIVGEIAGMVGAEMARSLGMLVARTDWERLLQKAVQHPC
jgi:hypothetical protein